MADDAAVSRSGDIGCLASSVGVGSPEFPTREEVNRTAPNEPRR
jgi:hypothetical protein